MTVAKAESEQLLNAALPFAQQMLMRHRELFPYGFAMRPSGEIVSVAGYDGRERPPSQDLVDLLREGFRADAQAGTVRATAIVYDIRVTDPKTGHSSDAIAVALDHRDHYSVVVIFRYRFLEGQLDVEMPFAEAGAFAVFSV